MFVQAVDNKLYENAIIEGDGFFIRFEDMEEPQIVIKHSPTTTSQSARNLAYKRFRELGMKVRLVQVGEEDKFAFPPAWRGLVLGSAWEFDVLSKIPVPQAYKAKVDYPQSDSKFLAWELEFPLKEVLDYLDKKIYSSLLLSFMAGKEVYCPVDRKIDKMIRKSIEAQLKDAKRVIDQGKETIILTRVDD